MFNYFDEIYRDLTKYYKGNVSRKEAEFASRVLSISPGSRYLDVACGYGRHMAYMPRDTVVGIDINTSYLKEAAKYGDVVAGDIRLLPFRKSSFRGAYLMHSTLGLFGDSIDLDILMWISGVLKKDGVLLIDVVNKQKMDNAYVAIGDTWKMQLNTGPYKISIMIVYNPYIKKLRETRYIYREGEYIGKRDLELRLYSLDELENMLRLVGMSVTSVYGDFEGGEYGRNSERLIVVAHKRQVSVLS